MKHMHTYLIGDAFDFWSGQPHSDRIARWSAAQSRRAQLEEYRALVREVSDEIMMSGGGYIPSLRFVTAASVRLRNSLLDVRDLCRGFAFECRTLKCPPLPLKLPSSVWRINPVNLATDTVPVN